LHFIDPVVKRIDVDRRFLKGYIMTYRLLGKLLLVFLLFSPWTTLEAQTLKIPYVSLSPTAGPLWIAYEAGFFKRNNISAELLYIPGGSTIIQSIISGDVKIANMAPPSAIGAWARGADLALVASGVDQLLETVVTGPNIKTPAELKGRKVGVSRYGSLTDLALREALHHYKLVPDKDVTILQTGGEATPLRRFDLGGDRRRDALRRQESASREDGLSRHHRFEHLADLLSGERRHHFEKIYRG